MGDLSILSLSKPASRFPSRLGFFTFVSAPISPAYPLITRLSSAPPQRYPPQSGPLLSLKVSYTTCENQTLSVWSLGANQSQRRKEALTATHRQPTHQSLCGHILPFGLSAESGETKQGAHSFLGIIFQDFSRAFLEVV